MSNGCATTLTSFCGSRPFFVSAAKSLCSLPPSHTPTFLPSQVGDLVETGVLPGHLGHAAAREDLRDVDDVAALVARCQQVVEPVDPELGLAAEHDLLGDDVRAAHLDRHVEALVLVVPLFLGGVVAGELRLGHPLELQRDLVRLAACARSRFRRPLASSPPPHPAPTSTRSGEHGEPQPSSTPHAFPFLSPYVTPPALLVWTDASSWRAARRAPPPHRRGFRARWRRGSPPRPDRTRRFLPIV